MDGPNASAAPLPALLHDRDGCDFAVHAPDAGDRTALEAFYDAFEPKRAAQGLPPKGADAVRRWLDSILREGAHLIVCADGELVGHAFLVPTGREGEAEYAVFLRADVRGRGLGTALNRLATEVARASGFRRVWLSVEPHNRAAIRSYEKAGFRFRPSTIFSPEAEMDLEL